LIADLVDRLKAKGKTQIPGDDVFKLYATYGFPKDLTRIIADEEYGFTIDEAGYRKAFQKHTELSGGAKLGEIAVDQIQVYAALYDDLKERDELPATGVNYDPYAGTELSSRVVALVRDGRPVSEAAEGQAIELVLADTCFYVESGGQVGDTGQIIAADSGDSPAWRMEVQSVHQPVKGLVIHTGLLTGGSVKLDDPAVAAVDAERRWDIMRNHTATHVLHRELRRTLGDHVAQAGSLVAPDRLRFDFSHPQPVSPAELADIEQAVNRAILADYPVTPAFKRYEDLKQAIGAGEIMALFGEKYGDEVRLMRIGQDGDYYSRELCGGTHVARTVQIGALHITSEGSAAAGVRRIEAVTGRKAQQLIQQRLHTLEQTAASLGVAPDEVSQRTTDLLGQMQSKDKQIKTLQRQLARAQFEGWLAQAEEVAGVPVIALRVDVPDVPMLREMSDWFRDRLGSAVVVLGTVVDDKPLIIATVTQDLTKKGLHAGKLVKTVAGVVGGGGGGKPTMAQAGGKDASRLDEALALVKPLVAEALA